MSKARFAGGDTETLEYLQSMLAEMRKIADGEKMEFLKHLLDMAYVEASDLARGVRSINSQELSIPSRRSAAPAARPGRAPRES